MTNYVSNNPLRLATGFVAGVALAMLLALFIFAIKDDPHPAKTETAAPSLQKAEG